MFFSIKKSIILFSILLFSVGCSDKNDPDIPDCVQTLIDEFVENSDPQTPGASVDTYKYENETVYVLNFQNFPDGQSMLISTRCIQKCVLGGIDGPQNDCENWEEAQYLKTIWIDPRS